jgi:hypothetical protein
MDKGSKREGMDTSIGGERRIAARLLYDGHHSFSRRLSSNHESLKYEHMLLATESLRRRVTDPDRSKLAGLRCCGFVSTALL